VIRNDRQYRIVRSRLDRLGKLEADLIERAGEADDIVAELEVKTVRGEIENMAAQVADYEALQQGRSEVGVPQTVADLPRVLIRARIAAGLTQAELADQLGLKPQQIQRYEATDYESASLDRLRQVAEALNVRLAGALSPAEGDAALPTMGELLAQLEERGLPRDFVRRRIMAEEGDDGRAVVDLVARLARLFNWDPRQTLAGLVDLPAPAPAFKRGRRSSDIRAAAYTAWADHLVGVTLHATAHSTNRSLPSDPIAWHDEIVKVHGGIAFDTVVRSLWSYGVAVLPLAELGGFHAAHFRKAGRDVIVLKHGGAIESLWLFDLLHEAGHIADLTDMDDRQLVEASPGESPSEDDSERRANEYGLNTAFGGRGDELFTSIMDAAQGDVRKVKRATHLIARREDVNGGLLAFHVAHNLALRGIDWWGSAHNLQQAGADPWQTARDEFIERVDWSAIGSLDRHLLTLALRAPSAGTPDTDKRA
jgi:transcriptional regulator with XRE-family HTH domain